MKTIVFFLTISFISCTDQQSALKGPKDEKLPNFSMMSMDSTHFVNSTSFAGDKPLVLFLLSTRCPYCRAQLKDICKKMDQIKGVQFFLAASGPLSEVRQLYADNNLAQYPNVIIGVDTNLFIRKYYKTVKIPYLVIYDKDKFLKLKFSGVTDVSEIKQAVEE